MARQMAALRAQGVKLVRRVGNAVEWWRHDRPRGPAPGEATRQRAKARAVRRALEALARNMAPDPSSIPEVGHLTQPFCWTPIGRL